MSGCCKVRHDGSRMMSKELLTVIDGCTLCIFV
jgi:hypothetical protein